MTEPTTPIALTSCSDRLLAISGELADLIQQLDSRVGPGYEAFVQVGLAASLAREAALRTAAAARLAGMADEPVIANRVRGPGGELVVAFDVPDPLFAQSEPDADGGDGAPTSGSG